MSKLWAEKQQLIYVSKLWTEKQFLPLKTARWNCAAFFLVSFCLKGKNLLIPFLCWVCTLPGSVHLLQHVCQEPSLLSNPRPASFSSSSVSQLTSASKCPSHAQPHFGSHLSKPSGKETKSACQKHMTVLQFKGQCSLSHVNDTEYNAHRRDVRDFC